jgi:hypothetical protein
MVKAVRVNIIHEGSTFFESGSMENPRRQSELPTGNSMSGAGPAEPVFSVCGEGRRRVLPSEGTVLHKAQ